MDPVEPSPEDVRTRAELLPEEEAAGGSDDPAAMAAAVLRESEERVNAEHDPPDGNSPDECEHEHRTSAEAAQ